MSTVTNHEVLLLNGSFEAMRIIPIERAMKMLAKGKAMVQHVADFDMHHGDTAVAAPSVIRMAYYVAVRPSHGRVSLTKKNVLLRDEYVCQYCDKKVKKSEATVDHVLPRSKGGPQTWENLVCACMTCNQRKKNRTPEEAKMPLKRKPAVPNAIRWDIVKRHSTPDDWVKYLTTFHKEAW